MATKAKKQDDGSEMFAFWLGLFVGAFVTALIAAVLIQNAREDGREDAERLSAIRACGLGQLVLDYNNDLVCIDHRAVIDQ